MWNNHIKKQHNQDDPTKWGLDKIEFTQTLPYLKEVKRWFPVYPQLKG